MSLSIEKIYQRVKTEHTYKEQGNTLIEARCVVYDGFVTFIGKSGTYHCTIYAGKFEGAKCDCKGFQIYKRCKHLMALAMWAKGLR